MSGDHALARFALRVGNVAGELEIESDRIQIKWLENLAMKLESRV